MSSPPRHAARPFVWAYGALGVVFVPLAGVMFAGGNVVGGAIALGLAGTSLSIGRSLALRIQGVQLVNTAVQHLTRGNHAETQALLATVSPKAANGVVGRGAATIRAMIALYEGRLEESVQYATTAIEGRLGILTRTFEASQVAAAHAVRALAYAAQGADAKAKQDADAAESSVDATPEVIARARLVRAMIASRAAYHEDAFRIYLDANARLVLEHAMPRERALFRALRRMSRNPHRSVYRQPARTDGDRAPSKLASWIAAVAPEAAGYVEGDRLLAERVDEEPMASGVPSDVRALRTARASVRSATRRGGNRGRVMVLWAVLVVLCVSVWQVMTPGHAASGAEITQAAAPAGWFASFVVNVAPLVLGALAFVMITSFGRRQQRALSLARRLVALGERARARPTLARLVTSRNGLVAATAGLELARIASAEAAFPEAISLCDAAIARVHAQPLRAAAADMLLPSLMVESAVAMAARGGLEDADAELAVLSRDFPTFPRLASAQLRVRLVRAVRGADRETACAMARARTAELPLPYREEMLADLVLASRGELGDEDLQRLEDELRDDAELRKWLDAVAPGLRPEGGAKLRRSRVLEPRAPSAPSDAAELAIDDDGETAELETAARRV